MDKVYVLLESGSCTSIEYSDCYSWNDRFRGIFTSIEKAKNFADKIIDDVEYDLSDDTEWIYSLHWRRVIRFYNENTCDEINKHFQIYETIINSEDLARITCNTPKED